MALIRSLPLLGAVLIALPVWAQSPPSTPRAAGVPASPVDLLHQIDEAYVQLFNKVAPSVVIIDTIKGGGDENSESQGFDFFFRAPDDDSRKPFKLPDQPSSEGSGFFIRRDGYIITNNHVIEGAEKVKVKLKDGRHFQAKVIGTDDRTDIAVLKIDATGVPVGEFGNSDSVRVGQRVCAIGVPFLQDYSFTIGCVSGKGRGNLTKLTYENYIQTDAIINPGNSGGPLFDVDGRVIGMNTLINGIGRRLAFAIPSNMLKEVSDQLIATGKVVRASLGIRIETLGADSELPELIQGIDKGVVIKSILPDTPAYKSDLRPADVITAIDGVPVATDRDLQKEVLGKKIGQVVTLTAWRNGKTLQIPVTTADLSSFSETNHPAKEESKQQGAQEPASVYGLQFKELTKDTADRLGLKQTAGALVSEVTPGSSAAVSEIQPNDVVTEIDSKPVANAADARKLLQEHDSNKPILLFYERKGQKTYAVLKIEK